MRRASKQHRLRHRLLADWRGADSGPLIDNPVVTIQDMVPGILREWKLDERMRLDDAAAAWRTIVGDMIASHTAPHALKRGILTVRVLQPAIHHVLAQQKAGLIRKLQEHFGKDTVTNVKFRHG